MQLMPIVAVIIYAILSVGQSSTLTTGDVDGPPSAKTVAWATANYDRVLDLVFGNPQANDQPTQVTWIVAARFRPAHDGLESQFVLNELSDGTISLAYGVSEGTSIFQQMIMLHEMHDSWNVDEVARHVQARNVQSDRLTAQARLRLAAKRLRSIRTDIHLPNVIIMDADCYHVWSLSGSQWIQMNMIGTAAGKDPVIQALEYVRRECTILLGRRMQ